MKFPNRKGDAGRKKRDKGDLPGTGRWMDRPKLSREVRAGHRVEHGARISQDTFRVAGRLP